VKIKRRNSKLKKVRKQGFRAKMKTSDGRKTLNARRARGRKNLTTA
jgi:large subunit ribosomal protein L34